MEKNNLEKLYQEKLKDFREIPDERVWASIADSLDKKKKKRVVPIWWLLGGAAAVLAFLLYVINPFETNIPVNQTTDIETPTNEKSDEIDNDQNLDNNTNDKFDDDNDIKVANIEEKDQDAIVKQIQITATNENSEDKVSDSYSNNKGLATDKVRSINQGQTLKNKGQVVVTENRDLDNGKKESTKNQIEFKPSSENSEVSELASSDTAVKKDKAVSNQKQDLDKQLSDNKDAITDVIEKEIIDDKKSIFDAIDEQKEDEEVALAENNENKWSVGPSIAPVYFDAVGTGSPIHSNFVENSKSGNVNLSYGLTVAYNLGKRLKVRSGIHKVDFGYDTNEVVFSSSLATNSTGIIDNINFSQTSRTIVVQSKKNSNNSVADTSTNDFSDQTQERDGRMSQQLGYLEVPLELNYTLVDKKFGVDVIGGFSSLFLVDNSISLQSEGLVTEIGEANNVNSVNFSTNFGIGLSYDFSSKIQINLEPVIKYQLNTFSETAGSFNPYSVGIYSGVRFHF